jgi:hypothetical protein
LFLCNLTEHEEESKAWTEDSKNHEFASSFAWLQSTNRRARHGQRIPEAENLLPSAWLQSTRRRARHEKSIQKAGALFAKRYTGTVLRDWNSPCPHHCKEKVLLSRRILCSSMGRDKLKGDSSGDNNWAGWYLCCCLTLTTT